MNIVMLYIIKTRLYKSNQLIKKKLRCQYAIMPFCYTNVKFHEIDENDDIHHRNFDNGSQRKEREITGNKTMLFKRCIVSF